jgi:hypothetical protein
VTTTYKVTGENKERVSTKIYSYWSVKNALNLWCVSQLLDGAYEQMMILFALTECQGALLHSLQKSATLWTLNATKCPRLWSPVGHYWEVVEPLRDGV